MKYQQFLGMGVIDNHVLGTFLTLRAFSENTFLVGGCVRDLLCGKKPKDWDFVTDTPIEKLEDILPEHGWSVDATGKVFLVLNISKGGHTYEVANFRKDSVYTDGRRPDYVEVGSMAIDASRRDFTINALYLTQEGVVYDPTGLGLVDVANRELRFIGNAKHRLDDDYLRAIRFYRFCARGYKPNKNHLRIVRQYWSTMWEKVSPERVRVEMEKICLTKEPI